MSEFTHNKQERVNALAHFAREMMATTNKVRLVKANEKLIGEVIPSEVIALFDILVKENDRRDYRILKTATNKIIHLFHLPLIAYPAIKPAKNSFLDVLTQNNTAMENLLKSMKAAIKILNQHPKDQQACADLKGKTHELQQFNKHYLIKENVLFPTLEKHWEDFHCVQLMWSYHDDIRQLMKALLQELNETTINLRKMNRLVGDLFFNLFAIRFREERILFPHILETIPKDVIHQMLLDSLEIGFPYFSPTSIADSDSDIFTNGTMVNLGTGKVSSEQIIQILNHLPVDITFVDEHDTVRFFSTPKKRIFPRTKAILGRKVHNCHPPESVHVVEEIVDAFKKGNKDQASFWINFKEDKILIQYFALRNELGEYKGVIEVTQEIAGIQQLKGERRLLDW
ncbi:PAS domain-containing protein [Sunxiuqinia sp. sy24]|uniref:PAS domain-containing protein n=1 Tax=Sunxiuqinia sp. sy24 TaxID=3461495 RepID=UPI0040462181